MKKRANNNFLNIIEYFFKFLKLHGEELEGDTLIATYSREIYEGQVRLFRLAYQNIVVFTQNVFLKMSSITLHV
jgi:hypothetical protein